MNIYSTLRSNDTRRRIRLIDRVRKYIDDDGFAAIVQSIDVEDIESIRNGCRALNVYMKVPFIRPRVMAWLKSY